MMDENMFVCCEIDEEEDYSDEFKEVVDNIIEYLEDTLDVEFEEDECFLQAIDVDDCILSPIMQTWMKAVMFLC